MLALNHLLLWITTAGCQDKSFSLPFPSSSLFLLKPQRFPAAGAMLAGALRCLVLLCLLEESISKVRRYYIGAVETAWDYTHSDLLSGLQTPAG